MLVGDFNAHRSWWEVPALDPTKAEATRPAAAVKALGYHNVLPKIARDAFDGKMQSVVGSRLLLLAIVGSLLLLRVIDPDIVKVISSKDLPNRNKRLVSDDDEQAQREERWKEKRSTLPAANRSSSCEDPFSLISRDTTYLTTPLWLTSYASP